MGAAFNIKNKIVAMTVVLLTILFARASPLTFSKREPLGVSGLEESVAAVSDPPGIAPIEFQPSGTGVAAGRVPNAVLVPVDFGSVIGEIVIDSGSVNVLRASKSGSLNSGRGGPRFAPLVSEADQIRLSIGESSSLERVLDENSKKTQKHIRGDSFVFNDEAAIAQIF